MTVLLKSNHILRLLGAQTANPDPNWTLQVRAAEAQVAAMRGKEKR